MEGGSRSAGHYHHNCPMAAPFVMKTYRMVDDPATDAVIAWGRDNNSFVVVDPFAFSQTLLPAHFKHGNFSSFVRQLNTYGFRKVDPDQWEFAHALFLRGQTHLLRQIVRRSGGKKKEGGEEEDEEEQERVAAEVVRLKQEQRRIEETMQGMWRRVQETERRPRQMLAFLVKVAGDPKLLDRLGRPEAAIEGGEKRPRRLLEMEGGGAGAWAQAQGTAEEGGLWGGDGGGGGAHQEYVGTMDALGFYGGGPGCEYGGVDVVDFVGGGAAATAAYPFPFHVENGF